MRTCERHFASKEDKGPSSFGLESSYQTDGETEVRHSSPPRNNSSRSKKYLSIVVVTPLVIRVSMAGPFLLMLISEFFTMMLLLGQETTRWFIDHHERCYQHLFGPHGGRDGVRRAGLCWGYPIEDNNRGVVNKN